MEKIVFFLDYANINRAACDKGLKFDYGNLLEYMREGRFLIDAYCYVPIDPRFEHQTDREIEELWCSGYLVTTKVGTVSGDSYKCDFDVEMTIDILRISHTVRPDIVVLATGDIDFLPVVSELRKMGIRVEIACFEWAVSRKLLLQGSDFIDLNVYYEHHYLSSQDDDSVAEVQDDTADEFDEDDVSQHDEDY